jgi:hypothetical protein
MSGEHPSLGLLQQEQLHQEFDEEWDIVPNPGGLPMWTALHREDHGERFVVAPTAGKLLAKLRDIRHGDAA